MQADVSLRCFFWSSFYPISGLTIVLPVRVLTKLFSQDQHQHHDLLFIVSRGLVSKETRRKIGWREIWRRGRREGGWGRGAHICTIEKTLAIFLADDARRKRERDLLVAVLLQINVLSVLDFERMER